MVNTRIFSVPFTLLVLLAIVGMILYCRFLSLLKEKHTEKWKELGSPTLFKNNSIQNNLAVSNFLRKREYLEMNDPVLTRLSRFAWNYGVVYLTYFVIVLILFAINLKK